MGIHRRQSRARRAASEGQLARPAVIHTPDTALIMAADTISGNIQGLPYRIEFTQTALREIFATNLRRLRNAKGLSQDDLAYEAEISRSYLS
jgi:ribosome-binding protein aMBF1 (putative translation factor)